MPCSLSSCRPSPISSSVSDDKGLLRRGHQEDSSSKSEMSAEVACEIQLGSRQSLIDNGLWQPALQRKLSLLRPWIVGFEH